MKLLVVEDDPGIVSFLEKGLHAEGYLVTCAPDLTTARHILKAGPADYALILLDLGLPDGSGMDLLEWMSTREMRTPVIVLTARGEVDDRVAGLNAGASDYVVKPFAFSELLARIRVALRSSEQPTATEIVAGDLKLDLLSKIATRANKRIELSHREWTLLELFMRHPGQVLSRGQILSAAWDYSFDPGSNVVNVYIGYLRKKLDIPGQPSLFQTVRNAGYRFVVPDDEPHED